MQTRHDFHFQDARRMEAVAPESIDLVVTSPPYPMIAMWDAPLGGQDPSIAAALEKGDGALAFDRMHRILDAVWSEVRRVVKPGGMVCINIGDAVRSFDGRFALYPNHSKIQMRMISLGFSALPVILWRKQTNAPNKFMGSGMLPAGAYVTLEHEYILIFRKGPKRRFPSEADRANRRESALFWEERNSWFSDIWLDLKGTRQALADPALRDRSAAFPFELPYRLISMFSVKGDRVLDPFAGIGTTAAAAVAAGRNSIGYEIRPDFEAAVAALVKYARRNGNARIRERLSRHLEFIEHYQAQKGPPRHVNRHYRFPVITRQEVELLLGDVLSTDWLGAGRLQAEHAEVPQASLRCNPLEPRPAGDAGTGAAAPRLSARRQQTRLPGFSR